MTSKSQEARQHFASDNNAGICPEALDAILKANASGHVPSYGEDDWTKRACDLIRDQFQTDCEVFFVFNGTAANALVLAALCQSYHSVICHEVSHIETDECGAPEFFSNGSKLLTVKGENGKITPARLTGTRAFYQRQLTTAIKRARFLALIPFSDQHRV